MTDAVYPRATRESRESRRELAPECMAAFEAFSRQVFAEGTLSVKVKQLIAVAVAHVTQCPYCIRGHTLAAARHGATREEVMEAIWVAAEMRAGAAYAHSVIAVDAMDDVKAPHSEEIPATKGDTAGASYAFRDVRVDKGKGHA